MRDLERNAMKMHEIREPRHSSVNVHKSPIKKTKSVKKSSKTKKKSRSNMAEVLSIVGNSLVNTSK